MLKICCPVSRQPARLPADVPTMTRRRLQKNEQLSRPEDIPSSLDELVARVSTQAQLIASKTHESK